MNFKQHLNLEGTHAFLGASTHHWLNYSEEKLIQVYKNKLATERGTRLHEFAKEAILLKQKLPQSRKTLNLFVNDAIGYKMSPEVVLYYSEHCYGTADAISFKNNFLRIHDLKTGTTPVSIKQLYIYAALFCLEYNINPNDISIELRIYQNDEVLVEIGDKDVVYSIIDKIIENTKILDKEKGVLL